MELANGLWHQAPKIIDLFNSYSTLELTSNLPSEAMAVMSELMRIFGARGPSLRERNFFTLERTVIPSLTLFQYCAGVVSVSFGGISWEIESASKLEQWRTRA